MSCIDHVVDRSSALTADQRFAKRALGCLSEAEKGSVLELLLG